MAIAEAPMRVAGDVRIEEVLVGPQMARELLQGNVHNRTLRETVWRRYARDMAAGLWVFNGETIKVSADGGLHDGQHRLRAVVEAGVTIRMIVVYGLADEAQETVDRGLGRNIADALRLRGEKNANVLAGAICQAVVLGSPIPGREAEFWPSSRQALAFLDANPSIRDSVHATYTAATSLRAPQTTFAALHFLFAAIDPEDAEAFFDRLNTGAGLAPDSPILALRETLLREWTAPRRMRRHRLQALCIKAWNAYRRNQPVRQLKWKTGGAAPEAFPRPE